MAFFKSVLQLITGSPKDAHQLPKGVTERELIELESDLGRYVFGPVAKGTRREFFCLDDHTWIWYEEWTDDDKKRVSRTTRYEVHPNGILKVRDGGHYQYLDGEEMRNFGLAVRMYYEQVMRGIYQADPYTGHSLAGTPAIINA